MQLGWKSLLKGTQVVRNDDTITLYRKQGSYAQAQREFYAMKPSNVRKVIHVCPSSASVPLRLIN